jgi:pimeloyl-ACP methyl ester carboxylesterase
MTHRSRATTRAGLSVLAVILAAAGLSGQSVPKAQFIEVGPDVRLEVVDWGGRGRPVVLLAGGGDTAHVYDELAPKLSLAYHVFGITRRGFGSSSKPTTGYSAESLADDVLHVLEVLKTNASKADPLELRRPVLIGHSVAGEEMSSIGARYPERISGLVYLDAAWDRTYVLPPEQKCGSDCDLLGLAGAPKPDPTHFDPHAALGAGVQKPDYARIRVPALALYAAPRTWSEMMPGAPALTDPQQQAAAERVVAKAAVTRKYMEDAFRSGVRNSRIVEIPGASHYIFRSNEADVLREIRAFLQTLP